jgi:hypothetical protein
MFKRILRTPNSGLSTIFERKISLDEVMIKIQAYSPKKVLFWGEGAGEISSYGAGWMAGQGIDVIVLDGANRFDPYMASSFAKKMLISPKSLLKRIRIARAFTCYQMAALIEERLISLFHREKGIVSWQKPWVILLGPITTFLDEDVPEREVRPLLERSLRKLEGMVEEGIPFFLFQPSIPPDSKRVHLMRRLFEFSNLVWKISLEDQGTKMVLEKGLVEKYSNNKNLPSPKHLSDVPAFAEAATSRQARLWQAGLRAGRPNPK